MRSAYPRLEVIVFAPTSSASTRYREPSTGVTVVPCFEKQSTNYTGLLDALVEAGGVDILHLQHEYGIYGHHEAPARALEEARREKLARAVVVTMHSVYHPYTRDTGALRFQEALTTSCDAVIVHSRLQEFELQVQGVKPGMIHRIPHGTLLNPYLGTPRRTLLKSLGAQMLRARWLIAVPGFLRPDKGLDVLLEALGYVPSGVRVFVAGEPRDPELVKLLEEDERVTLMTRYLSSDEILRLVAAADIIVLPYRDRPGVYSVSGILHLSMGALKPLIGTRTPRLVELYETTPRLTVPPESPKELGRIIRWVIQHYDYAVAYAATLYSYAVRTQWARMAARHIGLYRRLLLEARRSP